MNKLIDFVPGVTVTSGGHNPFQEIFKGLEPPPVMGDTDVWQHNQDIKDAALRAIHDRDPGLARYIVENGILGFHGTSSAALAGVIDSGCLKPARDIIEKGGFLTTGERAYANPEGQALISFVDYGQPSVLRYYCGEEGPRSVDAIDVGIATAKEHIYQMGPEEFADKRLLCIAKQILEDLERQRQILIAEPDSLSSVLWCANFPVAFGISAKLTGSAIVDNFRDSNELRKKNSNQPYIIQHIPSDNPGEFRYGGPSLALDRVGLILVPDDKISFVEELLKLHGFKNVHVGKLSSVIGDAEPRGF